jgi:formylglycine-generating enzyme required for sulfatase activity
VAEPEAPPPDPRIARLLAGGPAETLFVELPGGRFTMGSEVRDDEQPVREVLVAAFAVAITPVTNTEYARFLDETGHEPPRFWDDERFNARDCPVVGVSWFDAVAYCDWLGELLGRRCRLPTEAEREHATRGDAPGLRFPWGDEPWDAGRFALGAQGADRPYRVGSTPPNGFGLYHMAENVHEWCSDWYAPRYEPGDTDNPHGPVEGERRTSRGGSWRHRVKVTRITARSSLSPDRRYNDYGMRVYADPLTAAG